MKFFQYLANAVQQKWSVFLRNLPLRMAAGRFGIWLMKVGRVLQVRYANWNSEFRLEREFFPNPNCCTIHVSALVTEEMILTFDCRSWQPKKMTPMVSALFDIKGISKVTLQSYEIHLVKGKVYRWEEILPAAEETILKYLAEA